jgi:hypothetical protein
MRRVLAAGGGSGLLGSLLAAGWVGAVLGALCWIVNDKDRPHRLALILVAWRDVEAKSP